MRAVTRDACFLHTSYCTTSAASSACSWMAPGLICGWVSSTRQADTPTAAVVSDLDCTSKGLGSCCWWLIADLYSPLSTFAGSCVQHSTTHLFLDVVHVVARLQLVRCSTAFWDINSSCCLMQSWVIRVSRWSLAAACVWLVV